MALAVVLLVGAGLLVRSFDRLLSIDPGFRADRVMTFGTRLPASQYATGVDVRAFYTRLVAALESTPGVSAVSASTDLPLNITDRRAFTIDQETAPTHDVSGSVVPQ